MRMPLDPSEPTRILLNFVGFRSKFHIYEVCRSIDRASDQPVYTVRKQLLRPYQAVDEPRSIDESQSHSELRVSRDQLTNLFELIRATQLPLYRSGQSGVDGTWYSLAIGSDVRSTVIEWWSDREEELSSVYKLRDAIVKTVNGLLGATAQSTKGPMSID